MGHYEVSLRCKSGSLTMRIFAYVRRIHASRLVSFQLVEFLFTYSCTIQEFLFTKSYIYCRVNTVGETPIVAIRENFGIQYRLISLFCSSLPLFNILFQFSFHRTRKSLMILCRNFFRSLLITKILR